MSLGSPQSQPDRLYYFRGTTLQTDEMPIIQYLACDSDGKLVEKVEIYHNGRCDYRAATGGVLPAAPFGVSEAQARWGYGTAVECSAKEFEAMKKLALKLEKYTGEIDGSSSKDLQKSVF